MERGSRGFGSIRKELIAALVEDWVSYLMPDL